MMKHFQIVLTTIYELRNFVRRVLNKNEKYVDYDKLIYTLKQTPLVIPQEPSQENHWASSNVVGIATSAMLQDDMVVVHGILYNLNDIELNDYDISFSLAGFNTIDDLNFSSIDLLPKNETIKRRNGMFGSKEFIEIVKEEVAKYANEHLDKSDGKQITTDDVFIVWYSKSLQNHKALASTILFDGMYYELTYNGDKNEIYFDAYKKWENKCIKLSE